MGISNFGRTDRLTLLVLAGAVAATAFYALTSLALPFGWDHGIMASVGGSYLRGGLPYVDSWDMKGPLAYLPYALMQALLGPTMWGIRLFDIAVAAGAGFVFYRGVAALTSWQTGAWAALALYFWIASAGWFFTATPEPWSGWLCVFAVVPLLAIAAKGAEPSVGRMALAGALIGCAGLVKPLYMGAGIAPLLTMALAAGIAMPRRAALAFALALGAAVPIIVAVGIYALHGGLAQALEVHFLYAMSSYATLDTGDNSPIQGFAAFFSRPTVALATPFAALGAWELRRRPQVLWPCLCWLFAMVFAVAVQGKYYVYHWMPAYAPLVVLAAVGCQALARSAARPAAPPLLAAGAALMFTALVCAPPLYGAVKTAYYLVLKRAPGEYYASFHFDINGTDVYNVGDERAAQDYVAATSGPDDGVFVWGNDAAISYLADRPNPTRFTFEMPLSLPGPYRQPYRDEVMRDLRADPPEFVVVGVNWWRTDTKQQALAKFPELDRFVKGEYRLDRSFGQVDLYRRLPSADPAGRRG